MYGSKSLSTVPQGSNTLPEKISFSRHGRAACWPTTVATTPKRAFATHAGGQPVPIVHYTTYEALRNVRPLLASRSGLDIEEDSMAVIAEKIAELVALQLYHPHLFAINMRLFGKVRSNSSVNHI